MGKINWREWGGDAFAEARRKNKPVLLDIMATWCHWCHVMDETSYSSDEVAEIINSDYIPVRVDTDRRPDVNARYNMGGWPTTAFLTPEGDVLTGGTYIPPDRLVETLRRVASAYREGGPQLSERTAAARAERATATTSGAVGSSLSDRIVSDVIWAIRSDYDEEFAGFGRQAKFPHPDSIELLLDQYHRTQETDLRDMALGTLDAKMSGEIWDSYAGGFFRYATMRDWTAPHYEKLLSDQAGAVRNYVQAYQATTRKEYLQVVRMTLAYLESTLLDSETGAFFGSQSTDEEYYRLRPSERSAKPAPPVDRAIYTDSNADMAYAYLKAYQATLHEEYLERSKGVTRFLLDVMRRPGGGMCHFYDGNPRAYGMLTDLVSTVALLCEMRESTGEKHYVDTAEELAAVMRRDFADSLGGFLDVTVERAKEERLPYRDKPLELNGAAGRVLIRLGALTGKSEYRRLGETALRSVTGRYKRYGHLAAGYGIAVSQAMEDPVEITLVGRADDPRMAGLRRSALHSYEPYKVVLSFDPILDRSQIAERGLPVSERPKAFVCIAQSCQPPTGEPEAVEEAVARAGGHAEEL
ncbi:MAG: DUF255 domain-containing protein [Armatimonadota bacterium]|nr:DUF255 domain-containing protein [Armatimonadota bacterium]